jgi:hypothetical protein
MKKILCLLGLGVGLIACNSNSANVDLSIPQDNICNVQTIDGIQGKCKAGETVYFEPSRWGNEQLPLMFIALACDTNKPVYFNNGGVVCTFVIRKSINGKSLNGDEQESSSKQNSSN